MRHANHEGRLLVACMATLVLAGGCPSENENEPGTPASLVRIAGHGQVAAPGAAVGVAPRVRVSDSSGNGVSGVEVTFEVTAGGGTLQSTRVTTGSDGEASCGVWTLGSAVGLQMVSASAQSLTAVSFAAVAARSSGDIAVSVIAPTSGAFVEDTFAVSASVSSTYQLASVTVSVGAGATPLTPGAEWTGTISAAGQPLGTVAVIVTATDINGAVTDRGVLVDHHPAPVLTVASPLDGSLALPSIALSVTCIDAAGGDCTSLTLTEGDGSTQPTVLASGTGSLVGDLDLSSYDGRDLTLAFTGTDAVGRTSTVTRHVHVEASAALQLVASVPGEVWDYSGNRVLYVASTGLTAVLRVLDLSDDTTRDVATGVLDPEQADADSPLLMYGLLTPAGTLYVGDSSLHEWRGGASTNLGAINSSDSLRVAGDYAIFSQGTTLVRRDLIAGTNTVVSTAAGRTGNDVATNGDVAFWTDSTSGVYRWRSGTTLPLHTDASPLFAIGFPLTDGVNVIYRRLAAADYSYPSQYTWSIGLHDGTTETILTPASDSRPTPGTGYAVAGGYAAYVSEDWTGAFQIWRHGVGSEEQVTFFGSSSTIEGIASDGTVLLLNAGRRFRAAPGAPLEDVASAAGRTLYRDGAFYVIIDGKVLRVLP